MTQYEHLSKHPHLLRFCKEQQINIAPYSHTYNKIILEDIVVNPIPPKSRHRFELDRTNIDKCLGFAYKYGILNKDRISRLKGNDPVQFWSTVSELKVGIWLEVQDLGFKDFEPPSREGGKGDFLVCSKGQDVFVEVKTVFGDRYILEQRDLTSELATYFTTKNLPVESINLIHYPRDYQHQSKHMLFRDIEAYVSQFIPLTEDQEVSYENNDGLRFDLRLSTSSTGVLWMTYSGFTGIEDNVRFVLGMPVNGKTSQLQTSPAGIPSIYIINDYSFNIIHKIIEMVLYGTLVHDTTHQRKSTHYRKKDGVWDKEIPSTISAVIITHYKFGNIMPDNADVYLSPNTNFTLPKFFFTDDNIEWWQIASDNVSVLSS